MRSTQQEPQGVDFRYSGPVLPHGRDGRYVPHQERDRVDGGVSIVRPLQDEAYVEKATRINLELGRLFKDAAFTTRINNLARANEELSALHREQRKSFETYSHFDEIDGWLDDARRLMDPKGDRAEYHTQEHVEEIKRRMVIGLQLDLIARRSNIEEKNRTGRALKEPVVEIPETLTILVEQAKQEALPVVQKEWEEALGISGSTIVRQMVEQSDWYESGGWRATLVAGQKKYAPNRDVRIDCYGGGDNKGLSVLPVDWEGKKRPMFDTHSFRLYKTMSEFAPGRFDAKNRLGLSLSVDEGRKGGYVSHVALDYDSDDKVDLGLRFNEFGRIVAITVPEELTKRLDVKKGHPIFGSVDVEISVDPREVYPSELLERIDDYTEKTLGMDFRALMQLVTRPLTQVIDGFGLRPDFHIESTLPSYGPPVHRDFSLYIAHSLASPRPEQVR